MFGVSALVALVNAAISYVVAIRSRESVVTAAGAKAVEFAAAANMKRTWVMTRPRDWLDPRQGEGREFLRHASEVKNIWIPYGE